MTDFYSKESEYKGNISEVFGVKINSRYDRAHELLEILDFLIRCERVSVVQYIKEVFYDSQACTCEMEFHDLVKDHDPVWCEIFNIAHRSISQFQFPFLNPICHLDEVYIQELIREKIFTA